ncbi:DUF4375 domain-containing protein [Opitutus sp. ER46]|uniref:DMP19 family protein n=1 Tax=Opitutus sp. ER46 TaxID=2161864 RepID=UPI000D31C2E4|nr:DUF4375 domain-containing protein [Opitutus sp. ER46]PTY00530.1 hypothetical protein DB354_01435 [Opitutus sp. ER46]
MIVDLAMQKALDRYHQAGIPGLTEEEKTLAAIWCFEARVANTGFERFYRSAEGDIAALAPAAFRAVGSTTLATLAERANAVFGPEGVPADRERRTAAVRALPEEKRRIFDELEAQYAEYGNDLDERVELYLRDRPRARA